jgi:hypothetical protein
MIYDKLKEQHLKARKIKNELAVNLYGVILGECDLANNFSDEFLLTRISKMVKSNEVCLAERDNPKLMRENELLKEWLPTLTIDVVRDIMRGVELPENKGKKVGAVCQAIKSAGYVPDMNLVKEFLR